MEKHSTKADVRALGADLRALRSDVIKSGAKIDGVEKRLDAKIGGGFKRLAVEILKCNGRISSLEIGISSSTNRILSALDHYTKTAEANNRAVTLHGQALSEHETALQDHEKRISAVEDQA